MDIWDVSTFCLFETHHCEHSRTFLCWHMFTFLVCISLRVELVGHMVTLYITFWGIAKLFSKQWQCFPFLWSTYEGSDCSTSSPFPVTYCLSVRFSSLSGCDVVSHCGFDLHIFPWWQILRTFSFVYCLFVFLLWRNTCSNPSLAFKWIICFFLLLSCKSVLYILNTRALSDILVTGI